MPAQREILAGGQSLIQRIRVSKNGRDVFLIVYAKPGHLITEYESRSCVGLIKEGGAVNSESAAKELLKSAHVGVAKIESDIIGTDIIGTGSIKRPRPGYSATVARKSNHALDVTAHELGYVSVNPAHRGSGIGQAIVDHLLFAFRDYKPLFATTSNDAMKSVLTRAGFARQGREWEGMRGDLLSLWILAATQNSA